ncbi:MAG: UDP-N-acetylglucosamine 1-carboxyvinyltransferase [Candidatus Sungbacteria bacterium]|uniref:UDP-N-acetylglucosamine 1-carboxyvinyltransferase n=1 Tax=Candidatus Sungiibacteriota bacterium TaxID=2750080 RepID=A0A931SBQ0_9BACT|nr:UDP-N-acetylglucosamine 1-carboxyvinyltransferase [Candidatus Sungbacteria bacterium]
MARGIFRIRGGRQLHGEISVSGSKNTALPAIAAALLTREPVILENVPNIADVGVMIEIAGSLGAKINWDGAGHRLTIEAKELAATLDDKLARKLRGSFLFSGSLIGRLRSASLSYPGGDKIGARPLTTHLNALRGLGVAIGESERLNLNGANLAGARITLEEPSVTATENTILAAVLAPGVTEIHLADQSPHVQELTSMLRAMGANLQWTDVGVVRIEGRERLHGTQFRINPDEMEISGFAALAAATRSVIVIRGINACYLDSVLLQLSKMGVGHHLSGADLFIEKPRSPYKGFRLQSGLYPKLMSDHLPPFAVLATQAAGESLIHEWMYESRLGYIEELKKMGANARVLDSHRAIIVGPTPLRGGQIAGLDIRSGLTLVIAGLVAEGETTITEIDQIDRGYERIDERLRSLGADIERVA